MEKNKMIYAQESLVDEIIVDNFADGGGASTGIELAMGRRVAIAINHDPDAIRMHRTNHPYTEHLQASVWDVDPVAECRGRPVGLAWFSPDCKHFSKAKGAPINTVDASNRYGLTCANLVEYYTGGRPLDITDAMHTVTSHDREAVVAAHIAKYYGGVVGEKVGEPLLTVTAIDHNAVCTAHVVKFKGDNLGHGMKEPMQTVTTSAGEFAECVAYMAKMRGGDKLGHWPEIRALLNEYCGYTLAEDEVLLLEISGALYYIADIGLRMLSPRELYDAMGFPADYIIDHDYLGNEYKKSAQVARCGNAVCPPMATALVRANLPEWCGAEITTMAQLTDCVAV